MLFINVIITNRVPIEFINEIRKYCYWLNMNKIVELYKNKCHDNTKTEVVSVDVKKYFGFKHIQQTNNINIYLYIGYI